MIMAALKIAISGPNDTTNIITVTFVYIDCAYCVQLKQIKLSFILGISIH